MRSVVRIIGLFPVVKAGLVVEHALLEEHDVREPSEEDEDGWYEPESPVLVGNDGDEYHEDQESKPGLLRSGSPHYFLIRINY